jgi:hypothetical protein
VPTPKKGTFFCSKMMEGGREFVWDLLDLGIAGASFSRVRKYYNADTAFCSVVMIHEFHKTCLARCLSV